ncbi:murein hydrolase activator EnvC family protein [Streptomyces sp. NPDC086023]|uniref:murein hydrolase activator EnvC family protein n=1 Tax=Streptomyces sp. NPDC086023 TaxID=3365746 RepID=UPI0037CE3FFF
MTPLLLGLVLTLLAPFSAYGAPAAASAGYGLPRAAPATPTAVLPGAPAVRPLPAPLRLLRGWLPPPTPYAAGHRGVDLAAAPGTEVRAVAAGRVHHAGPVAGRGVLSLTVAGTPLRTTYEPVRPLVAEGEAVARGQVVAVTTAGGHCGEPCLHWGLLSGEAYLDPLSLLPRAAPRLLPLSGSPVPGTGRVSPARPAWPSPPPRP